MLQNLKLPITVQAVLDKFEIVFGTVLCNEELLSDYYNTIQRPSESVVAWACRLESHLSRLSERGLASNVDDMLRTRFWHGLSSSKVKEALRHRFERGESYKHLFTSARSLEHEFTSVTSNQWSSEDNTSRKSVSYSKAAVNVQQTGTLQSQLDSLSKQLASMQKEIISLKSSAKPSTVQSPQSRKLECVYCHEVNHFIKDCPKLKRKNESSKSGNEY